MANMSYCRFRNTLSDLQDCKAYLERLMQGVGGGAFEYDESSLSDEELSAAIDLVVLCKDIAQLVHDTEDMGDNFLELFESSVQDTLREQNDEVVRYEQDSD